MNELSSRSTSSGLSPRGSDGHAPVRGGSDDGQQRLHRVATCCAVPQVRAQRRGDRDGVAGGAQGVELVGDELPYVVALQFADENGPTCELGHQQSLDDAQSAGARSGRQASRVSHVGVVAAKLVGDRAGRLWQARNDMLGAQDLQHGHQRRVQLTRRAKRAAKTVAARQVVAQELVDAAFVEHARRQVAHRHPVREVRHAVQATRAGVGRIATAPEPCDRTPGLGRTAGLRATKLAASGAVQGS